MSAFLQYIINLLVGVFLLFFMASFFSVAAGVSFFAFVLVFASLFLASYFSSLSFFYPKIASVLSIIFVLPFFVLGIRDLFTPSFGYDPKTIIIPSGLVIGTAIFVLFKGKKSFWEAQEERIFRILIGIFAGIPALLGTIMLVGSLMNIASSIVRKI